MRAILVYATLIALAMAAVQAVLAWRHVDEEFEHEVEDISLTSVPLLSVSVWDIEPEAIRRQLERLAARREIGYVRLVAATGQQFSAGAPALGDNGPLRVFEVPQPNGTQVIAQLHIAPNPRARVRELALAVGVPVIGYGIVTLAICFLVGLQLRHKLEKPLHEVAEFARQLTPEVVGQPLRLTRGSEHQRDEIDLVVEGFHVLQTGIEAHIHYLDDMVRARTEALEQALAENRHLSSIDALTGCFNRRTFAERMAEELQRARRHGRPLSIVFADVDHFKRINDTHGHLAGDQVLAATAAALSHGLRVNVDWIARYGGEEFVVVLPETVLEGARIWAERVREQLAQQGIATDDCEISLTASFGVAEFRADDTLGSLLDRADKLLYSAKEGGRNRVCA